MKKHFLASGLLFLVTFSGWVLQAQELTVQTGSGKYVLSRAELEPLPRVKVTACEHSSAPVGFEGVILKSVLEKAESHWGNP